MELRCFGQNFISVDKEAILKIPLHNPDEEDSLSWMGTRDGIYSVRSGNYLIKEWDKDQCEGTSNQDINKNLWQKVWQVKVTPRQQTLIWRIIKQFIPLRSELNRKGLGIRGNFLCPRCNEALEPMKHCFKDCIWATQSWFGSSLG